MRGRREFALVRRAREGATLTEWGLVLAWAWGGALWVGRRQVWPKAGKAGGPAQPKNVCPKMQTEIRAVLIRHNSGRYPISPKSSDGSLAPSADGSNEIIPPKAEGPLHHRTRQIASAKGEVVQ